MSIEKKVILYRQAPTKLLFEDIFRECHRRLLEFLMSQNLSFDDAEDIIQEYFIQSFNYALKQFNPQYKRTFINYIKTMIIKRMYSFEMKNQWKANTSRIENYYNDDGDIVTSKNTIKEKKLQINTIIKNEIKTFLRELIFAIENENYRNAIILRLCIPISSNLSFSDISDLLGCHPSTLSTWLHRGIHILQKNLQKQKHIIPYNLEDILILFNSEAFYIDEKIINTIENRLLKEILLLYLFKKKDYQYIQKLYNLDIKQIKIFLVKGIFLILKKINYDKLLLLKV